MYYIPLKEFSEVYKMRTRIEDRLNEEKKANAKTGFNGNRGGNGVSKQSGSSGNESSKANGSQNFVVLMKTEERKFSKFSLPLSKVLERWIFAANENHIF